MDREAFLLMRGQIQERMERKRQQAYAYNFHVPSNGVHQSAPLIVTILKHLLFKNQGAILQTALITAGMGLLRTLVPRRLKSFFGV